MLIALSAVATPALCGASLHQIILVCGLVVAEFAIEAIAIGRLIVVMRGKA